MTVPLHVSFVRGFVAAFAETAATDPKAIGVRYTTSVVVEGAAAQDPKQLAAEAAKQAREKVGDVVFTGAALHQTRGGLAVTIAYIERGAA